jgi:hypothetical protein
MDAPPLVVSLTTTPNRVHLIRPTLHSLFTQYMRPDRVLLILPKKFRGEAVTPPEWLGNFQWLEIVRPEEDYGPGTKLLGALPALTRPSILVLADDDLQYRPHVLLDLYAATRDRPKCAHSQYVYTWGPLKTIGQGADGFAIYTPHLKGIEEFAKSFLHLPYLRMHDDVWISAFLQSKGVRVRNARQPGTFPHEVVHNVEQLRHQTGDLSRDEVTSKSVHYLVDNGHLGLRLQLDHKLRRLAKSLVRRPAV